MRPSTLFHPQSPTRVLPAVLLLVAALLPAQQDGSGPEPADFVTGISADGEALAFVENQGQWAGPARFAARHRGITAWVTPDRLVLNLQRRDGETTRGHVLAIIFEGGQAADWIGEQPLPGTRSFFLGADPSAWRSGVRAYAALRSRGLAPGLELRLREHEGMIEYDLLASPGADPQAFAFRCEGVEGLHVDADGRLVMETSLGPVIQTAPRAWQELADGRLQPVSCAFDISPEDSSYRFQIAGRDADCPLVIDPGIQWATFIGAAGDDQAHAVARATGCQVYVAGHTSSSPFPTTVGAYSCPTAGLWDVFVSLMDTNPGATIPKLWSAVIGGSADDEAYDVQMGPTGGPAIVGRTASADFCVTLGSFQTTHGGGQDAFVLQLDPSGAMLVASTFLGGTGDECAAELAWDGIGKFTVVGGTDSPLFPTAGPGYDTSYNGNRDTFIAQLDLWLAGLLYGTFLGGSGADGIPGNVATASIDAHTSGLHVDAFGVITVGGTTDSIDFPMPVPPFPLGPPYQAGNAGGRDAFLVRLDPAQSPASQLLYSTYLGDLYNEAVFDLEVDGLGRIVAAGATRSPLFPTTPGAFDQTFNGVPGSIHDAFVAVVDPAAGQLAYSTFVGSSNYDLAMALSLDSSGAVTFGGACRPGFPTTPGAAMTTPPPGVTTQPLAFVARLIPAGNGTADLEYSTYLGGTVGQSVTDLVLDSDYGAIAVGMTKSPNFPVTTGAPFAGIRDGWIASLDLLPTGTSRHGTGTSGANGLAPVIAVNSIPASGNLSFAITCKGALPFTPGIFGLSGSTLTTPLSTCGISVWINVLDPFSLLVPVMSGSLGAVSVPIAISASVPPGPTAAVQFAWTDPGTATGCSASGALVITVQ